MSTDSPLSHLVLSDCLWIRCSNRGSFLNSPALKSLAEKYLAEEGNNMVVVDLELCQGVDSTFMGTLAGIARLCMGKGGELQIASPTERTRAAMEGLGLDMLLALDPTDAPWRSQLAEIRAKISQTGGASTGEGPKLSDLERTEHVLDAHKTLSGLNKQNADSFGYVCESLEEDLRRRRNENGTPEA